MTMQGDDNSSSDVHQKLQSCPSLQHTLESQCTYTYSDKARVLPVIALNHGRVS